MFTNAKHAATRVPAPTERLADALDYIKRSEGKWFDGTLASLEARKNQLRSAGNLARQLRTSSTYDEQTLAAAQIENALGSMYASVDHAASHFVSDEIVESQRELPHFRIQVMDY